MKTISALALAVLLSSCRIAGVCVDQSQCNADDSVLGAGTVSDTGQCEGSTLIGTWQSKETLPLNELVFDADCKVTNTSCSYSGTYSRNLKNSSTTQIDITSPAAVSAGSDCMSFEQAQYDCDFDITESNSVTTLDLDCPTGHEQYTKQVQ